MSVHSAGVLLYRLRNGRTEVFLVHPGGPYWAKKDQGAWSIPKGIVNPEEDPLAAARREFREETGFDLDGHFEYLGSFRLPSAKRLSVWSLPGDCDPGKLMSNKFSLAWPPKAKTFQSFPEIDRGEWFGEDAAAVKIMRGQKPVLKKFHEQCKARRG